MVGAVALGLSSCGSSNSPSSGTSSSTQSSGGADNGNSNNNNSGNSNSNNGSNGNPSNGTGGNPGNSGSDNTNPNSNSSSSTEIPDKNKANFTDENALKEVHYIRYSELDAWIFEEGLKKDFSNFDEVLKEFGECKNSQSQGVKTYVCKTDEVESKFVLINNALTSYSATQTLTGGDRHVEQAQTSYDIKNSSYKTTFYFKVQDFVFSGNFSAKIKSDNDKFTGRELLTMDGMVKKGNELAVFSGVQRNMPRDSESGADYNTTVTFMPNKEKNLPLNPKSWASF